jgi:hypothetical protein
MRRSGNGRREAASTPLMAHSDSVFRLEERLESVEVIDSSGIQEIREVEGARRDEWSLDVNGRMTEQVARTIDLVGARSFFWPDKG